VPVSLVLALFFLPEETKPIMKEPKHKFDKDIENNLLATFKQEIEHSRSNNHGMINDFESVVDMFEGKRPVKDYEWYSNLSLKEGTSILLTDCSNAVNQYFQTRDFVEVKLEGDSDTDPYKCRAAKKVINKTLNNRRLYHYQKFSRSKSINNMASHVYALCEWVKDIETIEVGTEKEWQQVGVNPETNVPIWDGVDVPIMEDRINTDMFNYEIYDPRNVFVSDEYTYSVQEKRWITFRSEQTYESLKALEKRNGYINLDAVKELNKPTETETARETRNKEKSVIGLPKASIKPFDFYLRFGKLWATIDKNGALVPGYDTDGNILDDAALIEAICAWVQSGSEQVLVRFDATPFLDSKDRPYRPIVRGICYPHPTKDTGLGEGELLLDLNAGIDDAFNLAFDRAKLATIPTTISEKFAAEDNDSIFIEPGHNIAIEGGPRALEMFEIEDNLTGILNMLGLVKNNTEQVTATYPTTMGNVASMPSSTTATAFAGAEQRTNIRQNYKSITYEYTFLVDFYWIILLQ